jgi:hypothetical protein
VIFARRNYQLDDGRRMKLRRADLLRPSPAARLLVGWLIALSLVFQTTIAMVAADRGAVPADAFGWSAICHAVDPDAPADTQDLPGPHRFTCIACVIAHGLAPAPLPQPASLRRAFDAAPPWPQQVATAIAAARSSQSARGPPAAL